MNPEHTPESIRHIVIDNPRIVVVAALAIGLAGMSLGIWREYQRAKSRRAKLGILALGLIFLTLTAVLAIVLFSHMP